MPGAISMNDWITLATLDRRGASGLRNGPMEVGGSVAVEG